MNGKELLNAYSMYSRWAGDDFAVRQPTEEDHEYGEELERELLHRLIKRD